MALTEKCDGCYHNRFLNGCSGIRACHYNLDMNKSKGCRAENCDKWISVKEGREICPDFTRLDQMYVHEDYYRKWEV